jgi:hypothetical protein
VARRLPPPRVDDRTTARQASGALRDPSDHAALSDGHGGAELLCGCRGTWCGARLDPRVAVEPGGRINFVPDPARLHFFDADSGQAIIG